MSDNLEPGCLAVIIKSVEGAAVGVIVQCIRVEGQHSLYGTVWRVRSKTLLASEYGGVGYEVDLPAVWLRKIKPDSLPMVDVRVEELEQ